MICPFCSYENTRVLESRPSSEKTSIRRRRECENCHKRFTTYERVGNCSLCVIKKDGTKEKFCREKLLKSISDVCLKTSVNIKIIERIAENIEFEISFYGKKEITTYFIGEKVLEQLEDINEIAHLRYLSAFKTYKNLDELLNEIKISSKTPVLV